MAGKPKKKRKKEPLASPPEAAPQALDSGPRRLRGRRLLLGLALLVAAGVYLNSLASDFVWDDDKLIIQDPAIKTTKHFSEIWLKDFFYRHEDDVAYGYYRPVVTMSYMADYALWRLEPAGYHLTNILLHVGCTLLVALCLWRLGLDDRAVLAAALLFAVQPVHTENVAWIAGRTDLVAFLFTGLSLLLYLYALPPRPEPGEPSGLGSRIRLRRGLLALSLVSFALALLSKEMSLVLLPWLGLIVLLQHRRGWEESIRATLPHAAVAAVYFVWRYAVIRIPGPGDLTGTSGFEVLITAPSVMVRYLGKLLVPFELNAYLQHPYLESVFDPRLILPLLVIAVLTRAAYRARERYPDLFLMAVLLPVSFLPVLNFKRIAGPVDMGSVMAERFCYFPSFPLVGALGLVFSIALAAERPLWLRRAAVAVLALMVAGGAAATMRRNLDWRDELTFLRKTLDQSPTAVLLWGNLADEYTKKKEFEAAAEALQRGQQLSSTTDYQIASSQVFWYASQGRAAEAIPLQERIVRRTGRGAAQAKNNLAYLYRVTGRQQEAREILEDLLDDGRDYSDVHVNLAEIYRAQGETELAIRHYQEAYGESPHDQAVAFSLAALHLGAGDTARAERIYREQLQLYPDDPDVLGNLATTRFHAGDVEGALDLYRQVVAQHPEYMRGRISYAQALYSQGRLAEAVRELEAAEAGGEGTEFEGQLRSLLAEARAALAAGEG